jgi:hypothetical protein
MMNEITGSELHSIDGVLNRGVGGQHDDKRPGRYATISRFGWCKVIASCHSFRRDMAGCAQFIAPNLGDNAVLLGSTREHRNTV